MTPAGTHGGRGGGRPSRTVLVVGAAVIASLSWVLVVLFARAQWFDAWRCLAHDERSRSMEAVFWLPPHVACLDAEGSVLVRDYTETAWQLALWAPVVVAAVLVALTIRRRL